MNKSVIGYQLIPTSAFVAGEIVEVPNSTPTTKALEFVAPGNLDVIDQVMKLEQRIGAKVPKHSKFEPLIA